MLKVNCTEELPRRLQEYLDERRNSVAPWNSLSSGRGAEIKRILEHAFHYKCGYCEKIEADTVDHFWPKGKEKWPDKCWEWKNYVLACDQCQRTYKRDQASVDEHACQMVNPRFDEPLQFLYFDFETGMIVERGRTEAEKARGRLTIQRLGLDRRPQLQEERRKRFLGIVDDMIALVESDGRSDRAWKSLSANLHPKSPYLGIIRQLILINNPDDPQYKYRHIVDALRHVRPDFDELLTPWCVPLAE